jgi:HAD superfamily hydrolase (TIGR01509 family)
MSHNPPSPQVVAFDLGGVLANVIHSVLWASLDFSQEEAEMAYFGGDHHNRVSVGAISGDAFIRQTADRLNAKPAEICETWQQVVSLREDAMDWVARLRVPATIWSNTDPLHFARLSVGLPDHLMDASQRALSYEVGAQKPDRAFFEAALARLNISPSYILYLDDRLDNIQAALAFGIQAVQVNSTKGLSDVLKAHQLL